MHTPPPSAAPTIRSTARSGRSTTGSARRHRRARGRGTSSSGQGAGVTVAVVDQPSTSTIPTCASNIAPGRPDVDFTEPDGCTAADADRHRRPRHARRRASIAARARQQRSGIAGVAPLAHDPAAAGARQLRRRPISLDHRGVRRTPAQHGDPDRHRVVRHRPAAAGDRKAEINRPLRAGLRRLPGHAVRRRRRQRGQRQRRPAPSIRATRCCPRRRAGQPDLRRHDRPRRTRPVCWGNVGATLGRPLRARHRDPLHGRAAAATATCARSGTSMAAPMVAGAAALRALRASPALGAAELDERVIVHGVDPSTTAGQHLGAPAAG